MGMYKRHPFSLYMETVYPVLRQVFVHLFLNRFRYQWTMINKMNLVHSMFSLMFLHFFLYGCNIFAWRKTRINYSFIFELSATKELKYRDVFLICTTSMTAVMGVMFVHLTLLSKGYSYTQAQVIPGLLLLVISQHDGISLSLAWRLVIIRSSSNKWFRNLSSCYSFSCYYLCAPSTFIIDQAATVSSAWWEI